MKKLLLTPLLFFCVCAFGQSFSVHGTVRDKRTAKAIIGAIVMKIGSDGLMQTVKTDTGGHYSFDSNYIKPNTSYVISVEADNLGYMASSAKANLTTVGTVNSKTWVEDFILEKQQHIDRYPEVRFAFGQSAVTEGMADTVLDYLVKLLQDNPNIVIQLDGHCSPNEGDSKAKLKLSLARSESCKDYVVSQGIDSARIKTKGWGDTKTLFGCAYKDVVKMKTKAEKDAAYANDRRVEFRVTSFKYESKGDQSHADSLKTKVLNDAVVPQNDQ